MSNARIIRYRTTPETADENQRLIEDVYAELATSDPGGLRYVTFRLADKVSFVHVAVLAGGDPLTRSPAFAAFQKGLAERCVEPPKPSDATVVGSYRFPAE